MSYLGQAAVGVGGPWGLGALGAGVLVGDYNLTAIIGLGTAIAIAPYAAMKYWKARYEVTLAWRREQAEFNEQLDQMETIAEQRIGAPLDQLQQLVEGLERDAMELERRRDVAAALLSEAAGGPSLTRVRSPRGADAATRTGAALTEAADLRASRTTRPARTPSGSLPVTPKLWQDLAWTGVPGLVHAAALVGIAYALSRGWVGTGRIEDTGLFDLGFQIDGPWHRSMIGGAAAIVGGVAPMLAERWWQRVTGRANGNSAIRGAGADQEARDNQATDRPFLRRTLGWLRRPSVRGSGNPATPVGIWAQTPLGRETLAQAESAADQVAGQLDQLGDQVNAARQSMDQLLSRTAVFAQLELATAAPATRPGNSTRPGNNTHPGNGARPGNGQQDGRRRSPVELLRGISRGMPQSIGSRIRLHGATPSAPAPVVVPSPEATPAPEVTPATEATSTLTPGQTTPEQTTPDQTTPGQTTPGQTTRPRTPDNDLHANRRPPRHPGRDPRPWRRRKYRKGYRIAQPPAEETTFTYCYLTDIDVVTPDPVDPPDPPVPPEPPEPVDPPATYQVRPGDTLWDIAERELGDPLRWPEIYKLNRGRPQPERGALRDPDLIQPGWTLKLPPRPSQPAASGSGTGRAGPATPQGPGQPANGQSHNGQPHVAY
ncbi:MAG: LysM peptidoglycan-binding domain-containing protein, partial [Micromonosporaceae bacterium]